MSPAKKSKSKSKSKKAKKDNTIELLDGVGANPSEQPAKKNTPNGPGDRVRWWNKTDRGHTIEFDAWPFAEAPRAILVEAGHKSDWFTIYVNGLSGRYGYTIEPTINPASGPPDAPGILVGD